MQHKKAAEIGKRLQLLDHLNLRRIGVTTAFAGTSAEPRQQCCERGGVIHHPTAAWTTAT
jgi:hypothetical protein